MKRIYGFLIGFICIASTAAAQEIEELEHIPVTDTTILDKNTIYAELGGNGGFLSLNYDRIFHQHGKLKIGGRIGIGINQQKSFEYISPMVPIEAFALIGAAKQYMELGLGYSVGRQYRNHLVTPAQDGKQAVYEMQQDPISLGLVRIGYRYQPSKSGMVFRMAFTPILLKEGPGAKGFTFSPWGGISIGRNF
jgi:hypothetical protein